MVGGAKNRARAAIIHGQRITGLTPEVIAERVAENGPLWHERRQPGLASRPRRRAVGAGAKHKLVFVDRLLATLVHLRHGATHDVLACWFSVDRSAYALRRSRPWSCAGWQDAAAGASRCRRRESRWRCCQKGRCRMATRCARRPRWWISPRGRTTAVTGRVRSVLASWRRGASGWRGWRRFRCPVTAASRASVSGPSARQGMPKPALKGVGPRTRSGPAWRSAAGRIRPRPRTRFSRRSRGSTTPPTSTCASGRPSSESRSR
ncbi:transposase family protein [Streptomyces bacillaris]